MSTKTYFVWKEKDNDAQINLLSLPSYQETIHSYDFEDLLMVNWPLPESLYVMFSWFTKDIALKFKVNFPQTFPLVKSKQS